MKLVVALVILCSIVLCLVDARASAVGRNTVIPGKTKTCQFNCDSLGVVQSWADVCLCPVQQDTKPSAFVELNTHSCDIGEILEDAKSASSQDIAIVKAEIIDQCRRQGCTCYSPDIEEIASKRQDHVPLRQSNRRTAPNVMRAQLEHNRKLR